MPEQEQNLIVLIRAFQAAVARATDLFQQHHGFSNIALWREHDMPASGYLDAGCHYRYYFHGIGCAFHFTDGSVVDWDWGYQGRNDGFDEWRLRGFWEHRSALHSLFDDETSLKQTFADAVAAGRVISPWRQHYDTLYYLPEDIEL